LEEKIGWKKWLWRVLDFINPLRDPSLTVAAVLTFIEEAGQHDSWYWIIGIAFVNWLAVRGVVWLVVNFAFASTFISRRLWWAIKNPRLAWRILDAIGHEEIVIGGLPSFTESVVLQDGTTVMSPVLSASGIHIIGELPAGAEIPLLGLPNGQMAPDFVSLANSGMVSLSNPAQFTGQGQTGAMPPNMDQTMAGFQNRGPNGFGNPQGANPLPQGFPQRPSAEEERLRQQLAVYARLLDDWIQFTEEKWRTVSDSQLGWKPLRGRWSSWDDIFKDVYAAQTSDPMARAAQLAGEATSTRFETSREKGSAASAVACFMRDMMTLRQGLELVQISAEPSPVTPDTQTAPSSLGRFGGSGTLRGATASGLTPRNSLIRRSTSTFVDADRER